MASVSAPPFPSHTPYKDSNPRTSSSRNPKFFSPPLKKSSALLHIHRAPDSLRCRCQNRSDSSSPLEDNNVDRGWNSQFQNVVKSVIKRIEDYLNSNRESDASVAELEEKEDERKEEVEENVEDWDWERWKKHFEEVEEQERIVAVLKSQIGNAVNREEYECASKLKVAMAAAATNDVVGKVVTHFNRAIEEERYQDAAFFRDSAGAGLMGWWAGISEDLDDPYGRIIHIGVEHGRYVARSFSPRHLATATRGVPLFEIFLTKGSKGEYKQQVVYLKRNGGKIDYPTNSSNLLDPSSNISKLNESTDVKSERSAPSTEDIDDDSDAAEGLSGVQNILRDMMPGEVTVLKVTATDKVSKDFISKVIEQIIEDEEDEEDEDEGKDIELEGVDTDNDNDNDDEDDDDDDVKAESQEDEVEIEIIDARDGDSVNGQEGSEMSVEVVIGGRLRNFSGNTRAKSLLRVPARLDKKDRLSFSFSIEEDGKQVEGGGKEHASADKSATGQGQRSISSVMSNLAKFAITREKIPMKVLKDVEELISLTINQAKSRQPLSGTTTFKRIEIPASSDLLNGLYIGANGLYTSEVIHLSRKFGQWKEDGVKQKRSSLEFYEYVEALKLTGDPHVPAGQVAFRAKVGKQYQLPHKGIIPEEFGVVARYKGQGRLADPGFKNPRWVDGELVILDGKYIKGGPVVGFVYWAPDYHFLVFFNRLRLPE